MTPKEIRSRLFEMQDLKYKEFHLGLMPGVDPDSVIGIRTPQLRSFAKEIFKSGDYEEFLAVMPHEYYDEMNLHGFILCEMKDYDRVVKEIDRFLPHVNNWATCDLISPKKAFSKNTDRLILDIKRWMSHKEELTLPEETYTIRYGMEMLMSFFLDDLFKPEYLEWVASVQSEEYYVNMMKAWFFATALAKQYEATIPYIEQHKMDDWCHRKSIQKARESYRITLEQKAYLNTLK
ncbi:MAG: DNA alkylation repair protein [Lachnospiraceae bacterium]|nr:DNA alkylation repair protein [Lachnospiraceae bacterium]